MIGAPDEDFGGALINTGAVHVLQRRRLAFTTAGDRFFEQTNSPGAVASEPNDHFGAAFAARDIDGNGTAEVAIGVPQQNIGIALGAGEVFVTRRLDPHWIFGDGFDGQGTGFWSAAVP